MATRRRWTQETIEAELRSLIAELGHFPTRSELDARGLSGLYKAMRREGADWSHLQEGEAPAAKVEREHVAVAAYYLSQDGTQGDPVEHWLEAERRLTTA